MFFLLLFTFRLLVTSLTIPIVYYTPYFRIIQPNQTQIQFIQLNRSDLNNITDTTNSTENYTANTVKDMTYSFTWLFYILLLSKLFVYSIISSIMMVVQVAFHAKISDPAVGGTYMTLLNTVSNIGR